MSGPQDLFLVGFFFGYTEDMSKVFELGIAKVTFTTPSQKVPSMIGNIDKMSALGWELKFVYDSVSEVVIFYQREKESPAPTGIKPIQTPLTSVRTAPVEKEVPQGVRSIRSGGRRK